jgi:predicted site-specific integrase-resolvase
MITNKDFPLLTPEYAAIALGVSHGTINKWAKSGYLKCFRINSRGDKRFTQSEIERVGELRSSR